MPQMPTTLIKPGYQPQSIDTSIDADILRFQLLRQIKPTEKALRIQKLNRTIRQLSPLKDVIEDPISLALKIANILNSLGIVYYVGGSLASSILGEPRYSEDLDLIIELSGSQKNALVDAFSSEFYISETAVEDAVNGRCVSFKIISLTSAEKVDFFIAREDDFSQIKLARRIVHIVPGGNLWLCSAEDLVLQKLLWRKQSQSEKQWRDVLGILKVQGERVNISYLRNWAARLSLAEIVKQALAQAGLPIC